MKAENQSFSEALRTLAVAVGVPLPSPRQQAQMDPLLRANEEAMRFFQRRLQSEDGAEALAYLQDRGVAAETAANFGLGLSPDGFEELKVHHRGPGVYGGATAARGARFAAPAGRLTRPLPRAAPCSPSATPRAEPWALADASLDGSQPKYLNTPQTTIFDKSSLLWGWTPPGTASSCAARASSSRVHGRAHGAPARLHQRGGIYGHGADGAAGDRAAGTGGQLRAGAGPGRRGPGSHHAEPQDLMARRPRRAYRAACRRARTRTSSSGRPRSAGPKSSRPPNRASTSGSGSWRRGSTWTSPTAAAP